MLTREALATLRGLLLRAKWDNSWAYKDLPEKLNMPCPPGKWGSKPRVAQQYRHRLHLSNFCHGRHCLSDEQAARIAFALRVCTVNPLNTLRGQWLEILHWRRESVQGFAREMSTDAYALEKFAKGSNDLFTEDKETLRRWINPYWKIAIQPWQRHSAVVERWHQHRKWRVSLACGHEAQSTSTTIARCRICEDEDSERAAQAEGEKT